MRKIRCASPGRIIPSAFQSCGRSFLAFALGASLSVSAFPVLGQSPERPSEPIRYDTAARRFRIDAADISYALGVNEKGELQTLYWGKRLRPGDPIPPAHTEGGTSAFDLPVNATPQEFAGWGGGLAVVPDLKISFPDASPRKDGSREPPRLYRRRGKSVVCNRTINPA
jgi:hypothetical protein